MFMLLFGHKTVFGIDAGEKNLKKDTLVFNTFIYMAIFNLINQCGENNIDKIVITRMYAIYRFQEP